MHQSSKAIIIGSGVAGLASAVRLAVQGFEVIVFEKNNYPGGKLSHFKKDGYSFDTGPCLFTQPQNIEELFTLAEESIEEYLQYYPLGISCKYFYEDGTVINAYTDTEKFAAELETKTGEDKNRIKKYLQSSEKIYKNIGTVFLNYSLHKRKTLLKAPLLKALASAGFSHFFGTLNKTNVSAFTKPQTVQLFNRYATYNGSNPYKAPGMLCLIPHVEFNEGIFYPKGGMISITNALYNLAVKKGVQFYFDTPAEKIIYNENTILGVVANNENHFADLVVSNSDIYFTCKHLLSDGRKAKKILNRERSSSAIIFYWGIKKEFPQLELHNIFFSNNYKKEFDYIFKLKSIYNDPTVYINITSKCEPVLHAPEEKENWFVMINAPSNYGQNWDILKQNAKKFIVQKLNRLLQTDIETLIETEEISDPFLIENQTSSFMGSIYGTSSNSRRAAFLRHPNFSKELKRLYFAGGSVHPGGGIPLCLKSAKIMSEIVEADKKKWKH